MKTKQTLLRSFKLIAKHKGTIIATILLSLLITMSGIISSYTLRFLVDEVLIKKRLDWIWKIQGIFLAAVLAECFLSVLNARLFANLATKGSKTLRLNMFSALINADYLEAKKLQSGKIINAFIGGVQGVSSLLSNGIPMALSAIITIVLTVTVMFLIDARLTLVSLFVYPVLIMVNAILNRKLGNHFSNNQQNRKNISGDIEQSIKCTDNIRTFHLFPFVTKEFTGHIDRYHKTNIAISVLYALMNKTTWAFIMVPYQAILYGIGGTWFIKNGSPSIGTLMIFANFTNYLIGPVMSLVNINQSIADAQAGFAEVDSVLQIPQQNRNENAACENDANYAEVKNYVFKYDKNSKAILQNFSETFPQNKTTVLWGPSGSGKSTLLKIIAELISDVHAESGKLFLSNEAVTYFPQNPVLFNKTLRENFQLLNPNISEPKIIELLKRAGLESIMKKRPNILDEPITNAENTFSGGEHRRLCLVVSLSADTPVLLLDEPTASLDQESIECIAKIIRTEKANGKTLIIATHDEHLKTGADKVCLFET